MHIRFTLTTNWPGKSGTKWVGGKREKSAERIHRHDQSFDIRNTILTIFMQALLEKDIISSILFMYLSG